MLSWPPCCRHNSPAHWAKVGARNKTWRPVVPERGRVVSEQQSGAGIGSTPLTRRQVLKGALVVGASASLGSAIAACGGTPSGSQSSAASSSSQPKQGGNLRVGLSGGSAKETMTGLTPTTEPMICFTFQLHSALLGWDADYRLVNLLAESVDKNSDATVWQVKLRKDATFHDGSPVTADDVIHSYQLIIDPKNPQQGVASLSALKTDGMKKVDASTVEFHLTSPNAVFDEAMAAYYNCILPVGFDQQAPIGAGPFRLSSFTPGEQAVFTPHADYFGEVPHVDQLTVIEFNDATARVNALISGAVDAISQLPAAQVKIVEAGGQKVLNAETGAWQPFTMRIDQKPFDDVRVRQAFRLIPERSEMVTQAYAGYGSLGNDMYGPFDPGYPQDTMQRAQDLEQAKSLLKSAGYDNDLTVVLNTSEAVGSGAVAVAQVFAEQAKGAGVTVRINKVDPAVMFGDQYTKWTFAQTFWYTRNYLQQTAAGTLPTATENETHWKNDKWLALVNEAIATGDSAKRNELVGEAQKIEYDEGGYIIWSFNNQVDGYSSKLGGLVPDKSGVPLSSFHFNKVYFV